MLSCLSLGLSWSHKIHRHIQLGIRNIHIAGENTKMMPFENMEINHHCALLCSVISHAQLFMTPWTVKLLCPWGFSRQEYWSGLPYPPPGGLPNSGIELGSPALQADSLPAKLPGKHIYTYVYICTEKQRSQRSLGWGFCSEIQLK